MSKFWKFPPYAKYDVIEEGLHDHLYYGALGDEETGVDRIDKDTVVLYGPDEALLMTPKGSIYRWGIYILEAFIRLK
ncbi:MAG: hypothetical protein WC196_04510 [Bacilli bacterium]|jgi:hypothetical protein